MISLIALTHMLALDALLYENQYYGINLESMAFHLALAVCTNVIYGGFSFCMCIYFPGQELMAVLLVFIMIMLKVGFCTVVCGTVFGSKKVLRFLGPI